MINSFFFLRKKKKEQKAAGVPPPGCPRCHALPAPFGGLTLQKDDSQYLEF